MEMVESFLVLGLEPTKDERLIKNAYREKLTVTNPEDDPEGFKRLRAAYEEACAYAKRSEEEPRTLEERDESPSGLWLERAGKIYENIKSRQNPELWRELFDDDIFLALEEEENCRQKLLRYLMDHFRLPSEVWKLLNEKMHLVEEASALRESFPADFINFVVNRCERGEDLEFELFEGAEDAAYDLFFNYYDNCWQALQEEKPEEAARYLEEAAGLHIYHPAMEVCRGKLLYAQDKKAEACNFMKALLEKYPGNAMVCYNTAEMLWDYGDRDGAAEIYRGLKEENDKHYMANLRLSEWHYDKGNYTEAKKCAESVLSSGADDSFMELLAKINAKLERDLELRWRDEKDWESGLELCWCYLQDGKTSRGIRLATAIEKYISPEKETEYNGLLAKLFVEEAEYEDAIYMSHVWEKLLEEKIPKDETEEEKTKDQDRIRQAHMIRMQCYKSLGYKEKENFEKAIKEIEAVETGSSRDIGLWLEKAQIYMEMEEYDKSLELTSRMIEEYQVYAAAATAMEVYRRQWEAGGVVQNARLCIQNFPNYIRAYEHLGRVYLDLNEIEKLKELLAEAEKNHIESPYLEAYRYQMKQKPPEVEVLNSRLEEFRKNFQEKLDGGEMVYYEHGLSVITEYLYWYPGAYMLRRRAAFHKSGQQLDKALEDYEKALVEEPGNPYIHNSMNTIYMLKGDYEKALVSIKKAILYGDMEWTAVLYYYMAKNYMQLGDNEQALVWFRYYDKTAGKDGGHLRNMAKCLACLGQTEEAVEKLTAYYRKDDGTFYDGYYRDLVTIYRMAGDVKNVHETLRRWQQMLPADRTKLKKFFNALRSGGENGEKSQQEKMDYYNSLAWRNLQDGDRQEALKNFENEIRLARMEPQKDFREELKDIIFAAILCGEDEIGRKYAGMLADWLKQTAIQTVDAFYERPKARLTAEFLAGYYTSTEEQLQELLDREKDCAVCGFCLMPLCQELEGMRILLLLRQGKKEEAKERLARNLEVQPFDEYMQAIEAILR